MRQEDLARKLGVSIRSIENWEHDRVWPRNSIGALEEILGVDLENPVRQPPEPDPYEEAYRHYETSIMASGLSWRDQDVLLEAHRRAVAKLRREGVRMRGDQTGKSQDAAGAL